MTAAARFAAPVERLEVRDLACERGGRMVFSGLGFAVAAGGALIVTGPNGAGKSSLLRVLAGLIAPAHGAVVTVGASEEHPARSLVHHLGHLDAVKPGQTVSANLAFAATFLSGRRPAAADVAAALDEVGLAGLADLPAAQLSAGQRRRLAIARLVAAPRPIWLLDEPTAALDAASEARLGALMAAHLAMGGLLVAATHAALPIAAAARLELGGRAA